MTNVLAFTPQFDPKQKPEYLFMVTDSQSTTGYDTSGNRPKLVRRGNAFVTSAGNATIGWNIKQRLLDERLDIPPYKLAERILQLSEDELRDPALRRQKNWEALAFTKFVVAGKDDDSIEIYEIPILDDEAETRGVYRVPSSSIGSGARKVNVALARDRETGAYPLFSDSTEALSFCYSMGTVASEDIGVNERLQYGIITPDSTRMLVDPNVVSNYPMVDFIEYMKQITGIDLEEAQKFYDDNHNRSTLLNRVVGNLFFGLERELNRMYHADINMNNVHSQFKEGQATIEDYQKAYEVRQLHKQRVTVMFEAFLKGGIENIVGAVRTFHRQEEETLAEALNLKQE